MQKEVDPGMYNFHLLQSYGACVRHLGKACTSTRCLGLVAYMVKPSKSIIRFDITCTSDQECDVTKKVIKYVTCQKGKGSGNFAEQDD